MKVQLKSGEAVKFGGRRVAGTEDEPAVLVGDEAALLPLVKQGLATELVDAPPPPPPPPPAAAPQPEAQPGPENTDAPPPAGAPAEPLMTATAPSAPAAAKPKKRA